MWKRRVGFDCEVFPEWWCFVFKDYDTGERTIVTNETPNFINILKSYRWQTLLFGFYIKHYDLKIYNAILTGATPARIYELSEALVSDEDKDDEKYIKDGLDHYRWWNDFIFTDTYDDWLNGSLKEFEANIGLPIKETSVPFGTRNLTEAQKQELLLYCCHDVDASIAHFKHRIDYVESKTVLAEMFNISPITALKCTYAKLSALVLDAQPGRQPKTLEYVLPERVKDYVRWYLPQDVLSLFDTIYYKKNKKDEAPKKVARLFDNDIVFGAGGVHSTLYDRLSVVTTPSRVLVSIDVTSYYSNLVMIYDYMSRNARKGHLYKRAYVLRNEEENGLKVKMQRALAEGNMSAHSVLGKQSEAIKLFLNAFTGAMRNQYNKLYDPYQAESMCYTGQLCLTALANCLYIMVPNTKIIQTNTDGILAYIDVDQLDLVKELVTEWETTTGFSMEYDFPKAMYQRDVNNYIEVTGNPKKPYKLKGKWANQAENAYKKGKNINAPIVHKAILDFYTQDIPIEKTIYECDDILQFCFTTKTGRSYEFTAWMDKELPAELITDAHKVQKVNRVIASTDPSHGTIMKCGTENGVFRKDKVGEIPLNCLVMNETPYNTPFLDKAWYVEFANTKVKDLRTVV